MNFNNYYIQKSEVKVLFVGGSKTPDAKQMRSTLGKSVCAVRLPVTGWWFLQSSMCYSLYFGTLRFKWQNCRLLDEPVPYVSFSEVFYIKSWKFRFSNNRTVTYRLYYGRPTIIIIMTWLVYSLGGGGGGGGGSFPLLTPVACFCLEFKFVHCVLLFAFVVIFQSKLFIHVVNKKLHQMNQSYKTCNVTETRGFEPNKQPQCMGLVVSNHSCPPRPWF